MRAVVPRYTLAPSFVTASSCALSAGNDATTRSVAPSTIAALSPVEYATMTD
jgi:hypothetical protein